MLVPDNHITISESILAFGGYLTQKLQKPMTLDKLWLIFAKDYQDKKYKTNQSFDSMLLALDFLYAIGVVEIDSELGEIRLCA